MDILEMVFSEQGFLGFLLVAIIYFIGWGFYKIGKILVELLKNTLTTFLTKFDEMVKSIINLSNNENETRAIHTKEHNKIISILENMHTDIKKNF